MENPEQYMGVLNTHLGDMFLAKETNKTKQNDET